MTASHDIPADVMAAARAVVDEFYPDWVFSSDLTDATARAILAVRQRCVEAVRAAPHFIYHSEEEFAETGMIGRQASRADLCAAIQGHQT